MVRTASLTTVLVATIAFHYLIPTALSHDYERLAIPATCFDKVPLLATRNDSCGVPSYVDVEQFGNNSGTIGNMYLSKGSNGGLGVEIQLYNLPRPDLVMTAWIVWDVFGDNPPGIFAVS